MHQATGQWRCTPSFRVQLTAATSTASLEWAPIYTATKAPHSVPTRRRSKASSSMLPTPTVSAGATTKPRRGPPIDFEGLVYRVDNREKADNVVKVLFAHPERVWACDTEVADIDLNVQGPVGNGKVTCISIYGGPGIDFGGGLNTSILWVDNIDENLDLISVFKDWFQDENYKKIWHNYGFDRHVMYNEGIKCLGFGGDTMHMARLWDSGRSKTTGGGTGYSLAALSADLVGESQDENSVTKTSMKDLFGIPRKLGNGADSKVTEIPDIRVLQTNPVTRDKWIVYSAKDAYTTWQLYMTLKNKLEQMDWYSDEEKVGTMFDFYSTYWIPFGEILTDMEREGIRVDLDKLKAAQEQAELDKKKMEDIFITWAAKQCPGAKYINPQSKMQVGQLLFGKYVNGVVAPEKEVEFEVEKTDLALATEEAAVRKSNPCACKYLFLNFAYKLTLTLFIFDSSALKVAELKEECKKRGIKTSGKKKTDLITALLGVTEVKYTGYSKTELIDICHTRSIPVSDMISRDELISLLDRDEANTTGKIAGIAKDAQLIMPKKKLKFTIKSIGCTPTEFTPAGAAQVNHAVLKKLSGENVFGDSKDVQWGMLYDFYGGGEAGEEACRAVGALAQMSQIDTTIQTFLIPLQKLADAESRIHCSLNINTETGRLSARTPNLQNQPALEKDKYKIRDSFCASVGNALIVADYGQLELRLLAHMTNCKVYYIIFLRVAFELSNLTRMQSMIDAFEKGGCFHSRTAMGMYSYIREAVDNGSVLLEWDYSKVYIYHVYTLCFCFFDAITVSNQATPTFPLVKDQFGSERRKAKTLNFSIAYGKTAYGLAKDWGTTKAQAEETLQAWYADRPEVKEWQKNTQDGAKRNKCVRTLMGRLRTLPHAGTMGRMASMSMRAAINTPIQGGAADVVVLAMIKIARNETLKKLGFKLILQIHDEVILEGPKEHAEDALEELKKCMENPFDDKGLKSLRVHLDVDGKIVDTWYQAK